MISSQNVLIDYVEARYPLKIKDLQFIKKVNLQPLFQNLSGVNKKFLVDIFKKRGDHYFLNTLQILNSCFEYPRSAF